MRRRAVAAVALASAFVAAFPLPPAASHAAPDDAGPLVGAFEGERAARPAGAARREQRRDRWYAAPPALGTRPAAAAPAPPGPRWLAALRAVLGGGGLLALLPRPRDPRLAVAP